MNTQNTQKLVKMTSKDLELLNAIKKEKYGTTIKVEVRKEYCYTELFNTIGSLIRIASNSLYSDCLNGIKTEDNIIDAVNVLDIAHGLIPMNEAEFLNIAKDLKQRKS